MLESQQITNVQTYTSSYQYNLSGTLIQETYPSGRVVKNESRIYGNAPNQTEKTYANGFSYTADGKIQRLRLGNGRWESAKFNERLQVTELALGASNGDGGLWKLAYEYGELNTDGTTVNTAKNTGNIAKQTVSFAGLAQPFVQTYKYDSLYRITEARETSNSNQTWRQTFGYDRFGNRTGFSQIIGSTQLVLDNRTFPQIDATTNRFNAGQGYTYDFNGNLVTDADGRQFTFNGDNKQTQVRDANNNVVGTYFYDGEGKRVKKVTNLETTIFVYSSGKLVAEYSTAAPPTNPTTNYTATDQLGSPRVITNSLGQVTSRRDFMPFGEELYPDAVYRKSTDKYSSTGDNIRQRFTAYERDTETDLDFAQARYYSSKLGRFYSVDPENYGASEDDPQSWNGYAYGRNNPVLYSDPDGLDYKVCNNEGQCWTHDDGDFKKGQKQFSGLYEEQGRDGDYDSGIIKDSDGNQVGTYERVSIDPAYQLVYSTSDQATRKAKVVGTLAAGAVVAGACIGSGVCAAVATGIVTRIGIRAITAVPAAVPIINTIDKLLKSMTNVTRLTSKTQGVVRGDPQQIFNSITQVGTKIGKDTVRLADGTIVKLYNSTKAGPLQGPTISVNQAGKITVVRIRP